MLARILDTKIKRFGLVLILLSALPIAYTAAHYQVDQGFVQEASRYVYRAADKPAATAETVVLKMEKQGWAVLNKDCFDKRKAAWVKEHGDRPPPAKQMPLPRDCAVSYRMHKSEAQTVREWQLTPYFGRLLSTQAGYFTFLAIAVFMFLTGVVMVIGLFDRVGRWIFWGE